MHNHLLEKIFMLSAAVEGGGHLFRVIITTVDKLHRSLIIRVTDCVGGVTGIGCSRDKRGTGK